MLLESEAAPHFSFSTASTSALTTLSRELPAPQSNCFTYLLKSDSSAVPGGRQLNCVGLNLRNRTQGYIGSRKRCGTCLGVRFDPSLGALSIAPVLPPKKKPCRPV